MSTVRLGLTILEKKYDKVEKEVTSKQVECGQELSMYHTFQQHQNIACFGNCATKTSNSVSTFHVAYQDDIELFKTKHLNQ